MERLEFSVVHYQEIKQGSGRIDSEYFLKENLKLERLIKSTKGRTIEALNGSVDCSAFYPSITGAYSSDRSLIPFIRVNEIQKGLVVLTDDTVFLPKKILDDNAGTIARAYPGDIVIAKGGNTLAKVGLVTDEYPEYATCRDVIILRTNCLSGINKYYLWSFLHSEYGQNLMWRSVSQTGQPHITLPIILNMHIPEFSVEFQHEVQRIYVLSVQEKRLAEETYKKAQQYIMDALGIDMCSLDESNISIKSFKTMVHAKRFDAEYYQLKYEGMNKSIKTLGGGTVKTECNIYDENFIPRKNIEYKYIELANIGNSGEIKSCTVDLGSKLPTRARRKVHTGNIIISSIEGSLQSCAIIPEKYDGALCSNGFFVLDSDKINSETLLVLFKSAPIQMLLKQQCTGTILTAFNKDGLLSIPIPKIDEKLQEKVKTTIIASFKLRENSAELLEAAKYAVEIAIKKGETIATEYLDTIKKERDIFM